MVEQPYTRTLVEFANGLRERGVDVSQDSTIEAGRALSIVDPLDGEQFYNALRAVFVDEPEEIPVFDDVFETFWRQPESSSTEGGLDEELFPTPNSSIEQNSEPKQTAESEGTEGSKSETENRADRSRMRKEIDTEQTPQPDEMAKMAMEIGRQEGSLEFDVSLLENEYELESLSLLVSELGRQIGVIEGFRKQPSTTGNIDLRRSLSAVREPVPKDLPRVEQKRSRTKIRFFLDVSHSMLQNMDQTFLLLFIFECVRQFGDTRVFMFDTGWREVTEHFRTVDVARTLEEIRRAQIEWGSGTTIGACLSEILDSETFVVDRETVVTIISDGWDAGDIDVLDEQMRRLNGYGKRVIWLNPRAVADSYEPTVRGMSTALPYIDDFFGFATIDDLRTVVRQLRENTAV